MAHNFIKLPAAPQPPLKKGHCLLAPTNNKEKGEIFAKPSR